MKRRYRHLRRWMRHHPFVIIGSLLLVNLVAMVALVIVLLPRDEPDIATDQLYRDLFEHRTVRADVRGEPIPASVLGGATVVPPPVRYESPFVRFRIPGIGVDAPIQEKGIDANGVMESPDGPKNIAWYPFTSKPGLGGNTAVSGHVDYINIGAAVLWDLRKVKEGDTVEAVLQDGTVIRYAVTGIQLYPLENIPMDEILGATTAESITIITCGGEFSGGIYTSRLVVRATMTEVIKPGT